MSHLKEEVISKFEENTQVEMIEVAALEPIKLNREKNFTDINMFTLEG